MRLSADELKELLALPGGVFYACHVKAVVAAEPSRHVVVWHKDNSTTRYDDDSRPIRYIEGDEIELVPAADSWPHMVHSDNL